MNFSLTPEHEMTHHMVREFAEREVAPIIKEYDRAHKPNPTVLSRMAELGICVPICYGGAMGIHNSPGFCATHHTSI